MAEQTKPVPPREMATIKTDRQMSTVRYSPCGMFLAAAGRDATIRFWNLVESQLVDPAPAADPKKPPETLIPELRTIRGQEGKGHNGWVTGIEFHPRELRLFSADSWGQIACWPVAGQEPKGNQELPGDQQAQPVWSVPQAHDGWVRQIALSADGQRLATCGMDKKVQVWSTADGAKIQELIGHADDVYSVAFHPDGKSLVSGDLKGLVKHWDLETGKPLRDFDAKILYTYSYIQDVGGARVVAFDREGNTLVCAGTQPAGGGFVQGTPVLKFFDWKTGTETKTLKLGDTADVYITELLFHPQGFWVGVASGQPGKGKFFFLRPGEEQPYFVAPTANCHSVSMHPNGQRLAVIGNAGTHGQIMSRAREGDYPGNWSPITIWEMGKEG